jgi:hypothetical protein
MMSAALAIAFVVAFLFGLRNYQLLFAAILLWFPTLVACRAVRVRFLPPPKLEPFRPRDRLGNSLLTLFPKTSDFTADQSSDHSAGQAGQAVCGTKSTWPTGTYSDHTFCPNCRERIRLEHVSIASGFTCEHCGSQLSMSPLYRAVMLIVCFVASLMLSWLFRLQAYAALAWIPLLLISLGLVPNIGKFAVPPALKVQTEVSSIYRQPLRAFGLAWIGVTLTILAYGFVIGWIASLLGGSPRDIQESTGLWSFDPKPKN